MPYHTLHLLFNNRLDKIEELYLNLSLRAFAVSMISIFVPIYLLQLDYSLSSVLLFYVIISLTHAAFVFPSAIVSARFGFKHAIFLSTPLLILFYFLLHTLNDYNWPLSMVAIVFGIENALFWFGYHAYFSRVGDANHRGEEISFARIFRLIAGITGPLVGGLLITFASFKFLFIIVPILLIVSCIPLFLSKDTYASDHLSLNRVFAGRKIRDYLAFIGYGIETGAGLIVWPIIAFFSILHSFTALGFITSLSLFFSFIATLIIGRYTDIQRRLVLRAAALLNVVIWIARMFVRTSLHIVATDSLYGMTRTAIGISFDALSYDKANKDGLLASIAMREITIQIGRAILFASLVVIAEMGIGLLLGSGASFLYLFF